MRCRLFGHRFRYYWVGKLGETNSVVLCERCGKTGWQ